ncbi:MAG TPA: hypothetical protein VF210_12155, partial [Pseudomonadales bacterium]
MISHGAIRLGTIHRARIGRKHGPNQSMKPRADRGPALYLEPRGFDSGDVREFDSGDVCDLIPTRWRFDSGHVPFRGERRP